MVRFRDFMSRNGADRGQRRPSPDESFLTPYERPSQPPMPTAAPPAVPESITPPVTDFNNRDVKLDLSATYSPGDTMTGTFAGSLPPYVSREPSVATPPYNLPYQRPIVPPTYNRTPAPAVHFETTHTPATSASSLHHRHTSMPTTSGPERTPHENYGPPPMRSVSSSAGYTEQPPMPPSAAPAVPPATFRGGSPLPATGDYPLERSPGQKIKPEELRELREMIRLRYQLDLVIWQERFLRPRDRDVTQAKILKADALMNKIRRTVDTWNRPEFFERGTRDYEEFQEIVARIHAPGKRDWVNEPPWMQERRLH